MNGVARVNSKKYFRETVLSVFPLTHISRKPQLINKAIDILACYIPGHIPKRTQELQETFVIPKKLKSSITKYDLPNAAFQELADFLKGKKQLDEDGIKYVRFVEQEMISYASHKLEQMDKFTFEKPSKYDEQEELLSYLRAESPRGVSNTCCYRCGKLLERHNADPITSKQEPHYCVRSESGVCFNNRRSLEKQREFEWKSINRQCPHCEKELTLSADMSKNHYHNGEFFCSGKGYAAYRKSLQRQIL